eukprot:1945114-Karenia_brevis.AAC.1
MLLKIPSLDCYIRKRRLKYLARLFLADLDALHAVLQASGKHGQNLPWVNMIVQDLQVLRKAVPRKLDSLPDPACGLRPYWELIRCHPQEWRELVDMYHTIEDDIDGGHGKASKIGASTCGHA